MAIVELNAGKWSLLPLLYITRLLPHIECVTYKYNWKIVFVMRLRNYALFQAIPEDIWYVKNVNWKFWNFCKISKNPEFWIQTGRDRDKKARDPGIRN